MWENACWTHEIRAAPAIAAQLSDQNATGNCLVQFSFFKSFIPRGCNQEFSIGWHGIGFR
jgi:hypothetical protein